MIFGGPLAFAQAGRFFRRPVLTIALVDQIEFIP